ncbi:hypothetical protein IGI49_004807 [Enterococcus sp. AZ071]
MLPKHSLSSVSILKEYFACTNGLNIINFSGIFMNLKKQQIKTYADDKITRSLIGIEQKSFENDKFVVIS